MNNLNNPIIALTFDDGPNTTTTVQILDLLEQYGIVASFFLVGNNINEQSAKAVKRAADMGCEINNHSLTHSAMDTLSAEEIKAEIKETSERIFGITGKNPPFFRPPYIAVNQTMRDSIDMPFICGFGAEDWEDSVSADERAERVLSQARDGAIILLHDMEGNFRTVDALKKIIPNLLDKGYRFVTVSQLFEEKDVTPETDKPTIYSCLD
jgi:peptidoglycan/xylan/chitin deacetylase (PgdA/CDA1 family)